MSQVFQTALNIMALIFMPGASGTIRLQVPGMTSENLDLFYIGIEDCLKLLCPMIERNGNLFTAPTCEVKVFIRLDQFHHLTHPTEA